jgi:hypothetical protein
VYLARVINIPAVQCHREAVTDDCTLPFFNVGCRPGRYGDFQWSLDAPEALPWGMNPVSLPMQLAWNAAAAAFEEFIKALAKGELIASGTPATGVRCDLEQMEWTRGDLILDVINGDLIDGRYSSVRWSNIKLREAKQPRQKKERWHGYDWDGAWAYALTLRAEDQWDWKKHLRDKKQPLPGVPRVVVDKIVEWFKARGSVPDIRDIRRNITIPLYKGRLTRGKRKR